MRSRRDQLQAYQFLRHRIVSALLSGEPESVESPMRRIVRTSFAGLMVAVIALAVFGIIGLLKQDGASGWRAQDTIVMEKGTGAAYVWKKGRLYPMLNYTSARLFLGSDVQASVSRKSLAGIPRQQTLGIAGAPSSPPSASDLVDDPWTVCARPFGSQAKVTLLVGTRTLPGSLGPDSAALVTTGIPGEDYLVWREHAFPVHSEAVTEALGFRSVNPQRVGPAWVAALERGPEITFPQIAGRGAAGNELGGQSTVIGQVFVVKGIGPDQYSVMLSGGLFAVSPVVAALVLAAPHPLPNPGPVTIAPNAAGSARKAPVNALDVGGYPDRTLTAAGGPDRPVLCATITGTTGKLTRSVHALADLPPFTEQHVQSAGAATPTADEVYVQPGRGALARDGTNPTVFLVVDGRRYPMGGSAALQALGYNNVRISVLPGFFLSLLPTGPPLSSKAAGQPASLSAATAPGASPAP